MWIIFVYIMQCQKLSVLGYDVFPVINSRPQDRIRHSKLFPIIQSGLCDVCCKYVRLQSAVSILILKKSWTDVFEIFRSTEPWYNFLTKFRIPSAQMGVAQWV